MSVRLRHVRRILSRVRRASCLVFPAGSLVLLAADAASEQIASVNGPVRAVVVWGNDLVAGGDFTIAGNVPVQYLARWDGSRWHAVGSGTNGPVHAVATFQGQLFVGGDFTEAGGQPANHVAAWDGSQWTAFGSGTNGPVNALATLFGLFVYAGGSFSDAGGVAANNVAEWFNGSWRAMGDGLDGTVESMTMKQNTVIAGGDFQIAGRPIGDRQIASFSAGAWVPENTAIVDGRIHAVADAYGTLVAGGVFRQVWWQTTGISVGRKVGPRWQPLSVGLSQGEILTPGEVFAMSPYAGGIAAGGTFTLADAFAAQNVAFYDGSVWTPLGSGVDGPVLALVEYQGQLVVAGAFATAGGLPAANVATWTGVAWDVLTPVTLQDVRIGTAAGSVTLSWRLTPADRHGLRDVVVERSDAAAGPFAAVSAPLLPDLQMSWRDTNVQPNRTYWYRMRFESAGGEPALVGPLRAATPALGDGVGRLSAHDPGAGRAVEIRYQLAGAADVRLEIFDVRGRTIRLLDSGARDPGVYLRTWDRTDSDGRSAARGVYFVHLDAGAARSSRRLLLLSR